MHGQSYVMHKQYVNIIWILQKCTKFISYKANGGFLNAPMSDAALAIQTVSETV